jgi:hypothetical protein
LCREDANENKLQSEIESSKREKVEEAERRCEIEHLKHESIAAAQHAKRCKVLLKATKQAKLIH